MKPEYDYWYLIMLFTDGGNWLGIIIVISDSLGMIYRLKWKPVVLNQECV